MIVAQIKGSATEFQNYFALEECPYICVQKASVP